MTIGYIGNGKSTNRYHLPYVLERKDKIRVKKIWEHSNKRKWDTIEDVEYTTDLDEILEDPDIQVLVVTTPPQTHYEMAKKVLEAGKNCVVEKPFTLDYSQAQELFKLAEDKNLTLECYQNRRFDSDFLTVKKVINSKKLGKIFELEVNYDYYRPEVPENSDGFSVKDSFVFSHACHTLDQVVSLFGIPTEYRSDTGQLLGPGRMNDYFDFDLYYPGAKVSVRSSYFRIKPRSKFVLYGRRGMFEKVTEDQQEADLKKFYMPGHSDFGVDKPDQYGTIIYNDQLNNYHEEKVVSEKGDYGRYYDYLYETIINGREPLVKKDETLKVMQMMTEAVSHMS